MSFQELPKKTRNYTIVSNDFKKYIREGFDFFDIAIDRVSKLRRLDPKAEIKLYRGYELLVSYNLKENNKDICKRDRHEIHCTCKVKQHAS